MLTGADTLNRYATALGWKIKDGRIGPIAGFGRRSIPIAGASASTLDESRRRVTATRALTLGIFALAAKKKVGAVTVLVAGPEGRLVTKTKKVNAAWEFAVMFNQLHGTPDATVV